ncbi:hypothetical protein [Methanolobus sp. ZRKC5]|uniref:hypothetical protein n=1 Tax=unclassified Methanolobus TaxID=2629569 RepID=UPI00313AE927
MDDQKVFNLKSNMDVNYDGDALVMCPECDSEINVAFSNIVDESLVLGECIICLLCGASLDQVHPSKATTKKIADYVEKEMLKDLEKELGQIFK